MKPQLATDAVLDLIQYPKIVLPKLDGVRAMKLTPTLTGRSLDPFPGFGITEYFDDPAFNFLDGEMILGSVPNSTDRLCSRTTGAMGRFKKVTEMADLHWWVFDYLKDPGDAYRDRYSALQQRVGELSHSRIHLVPAYMAQDRAELDAFHAAFLEDGYEGTIIRDPGASAKEGRATQKGQQYWRIKPWADAEMLVTGITEGAKNTNEVKTNSLGRTERSSTAAGMVPNGMVGSIQGVMLADFVSDLTGEVLFAKGLPISIGPGEMTEVEAKYYFENPRLIVGNVVKFVHMTHGVKDLPRFGYFKSLRLLTDMS